MSQFTVIITDNVDKTNYKIKRNRQDEITEKHKTYLTTETNKILLKPPLGKQLQEYDADVVVNETPHTNLTQIPAKPEAIQVNKNKDTDQKWR